MFINYKNQPKKKFINRDETFKKFEKIKLNAEKKIPKLKEKLLLEKIFNNNIYYKRSYKLFSEFYLQKNLFQNQILLPKLKLPNINKKILQITDENYFIYSEPNFDINKFNFNKKPQFEIVKNNKINNSNIYKIKDNLKSLKKNNNFNNFNNKINNKKTISYKILKL